MANSPRSNGRKRAGEGSGLGLLVLSFTSVSTLGWRLRSSAGLLNPSLGGPGDWRNYVCLVLYVRWLKKKKVGRNLVTPRPTSCYCLGTLVV